MTSATLSFATPGRVTFHCDALDLDERRELESGPPFTDWSAAYEAGYWSAEALLGIGLVIGRWFDGPQHWLARLRTAPGPVILTIQTRSQPTAIEKAALDVPWELIAYLEPALDVAPSPGPVVDPQRPDPLIHVLAQLGAVDFACARHMAMDPGLALTAVRRLGQAVAPLPPSQFRLSVVFMPAQPDGLDHVEADLEETLIYQAVRGIGVDLAVEDSGSLVGIADMVGRVGDCDVVQLSCHGAGGLTPLLALEDGFGNRLDATAADLSNGFGTKPRLLFLSACSTAAAAPSSPSSAEQSANALGATLGSEVVWPLAVDLCRRGWPAVLGWSTAVSNSSAIAVAAALYRQLALRAPLEEALAKVRTGPAWHKLRLFVGPRGGGPLIDSTRLRPDQPDFVRAPQFLDPATRRIPIAAPDTPFPYRREFQRVMATMRDGDYNGVVVHGGDELARATFVGRVLRRGDRDRSRVVVAGPFDAPAILQEVRVQAARRDVDRIVTTYSEAVSSDPAQLLPALRAIIEGPCRMAGNGAFMLVLHRFDPIAASPAQPDKRPALPPELLAIARALIRSFAGAATASRLLFTSAAAFSVIDADGSELAASLRAASLDP
jgi:hypothetical protein